MEGAVSTFPSFTEAFSFNKPLTSADSFIFSASGKEVVRLRDSGESFLDGGVFGLLSASPDLNTEAIPTGWADLDFVGSVTLLTEALPFFAMKGGEPELTV